MIARALRSSPSVRRLHAAWRRERTIAHARGLLTILAAAIALVLADLAIDRLLVLPAAGRVVLIAANALALGALGRRVWWLRLRRWDAVRVALQVEALSPDLESILVSHVQLLGDAKGSGSPRLIEALHERAAARTAPLDFVRIVDPRTVRPAAAAAVGLAGTLAIVAVAAHATFLVFLERMLDPSSSVGYPTRTVIEWTTGDIVVPQGARVFLAARVSGEIPEDGFLDVRFPDASWEALPARRDAASGEFAAAVERSMRSFEYRFRIGDARSRATTVDVVPPPRIAASRVRIEFPAYTRLQPRECEVLNVEAIEGSGIEWEVRCDRAVAAGEILREPGAPLALEIDPADPRIARRGTSVAASFGYRFRWTHGPGFVHQGSIAHAVKVIPDAPPRVEVLQPEGEEKGTVRKEVEILFRARDDFGLGDAAIVYAVNDGPEARHALGSLAGRGEEASVEARWRPAESVPSLEEGDVVRYRIEVADTRAERGPNVGRSAPLRLAIVSVDAYLKYVSERRSRILSGLQGALREEDEGSKNVKTIKDAAR